MSSVLSSFSCLHNIDSMFFMLSVKIWIQYSLMFPPPLMFTGNESSSSYCHTSQQVLCTSQQSLESFAGDSISMRNLPWHFIFTRNVKHFASLQGTRVQVSVPLWRTTTRWGRGFGVSHQVVHGHAGLCSNHWWTVVYTPYMNRITIEGQVRTFNYLVL